MADQGLLAKSGLDSIKIGGHKVPIALIAGGIALVGVVAVLRARQGGGQVASIGQGPATAAGSGFGTPLPSSDPGPAIADLAAQLNSIGQSINASNSTSSSAPQIFANSQPAGYGGAGIPIFGNPNDPSTYLGTIDWGSLLKVSGSPTTGRQVADRGNQWEQVTGPTGITGWAFVGDTTAK